MMDATPPLRLLSPRAYLLMSSMVALSALGLALPACSGADAGVEPATLTVFAPSSTTEAMRALAQRFEQDHPGSKVRLQLAGTQALRTQLEHGAAADIFISASQPHMQALRSQELVQEPFRIASNRLAIIIPADNPLGLATLPDLAKVRRLILGAPQVPIGAYALGFLEELRLSNSALVDALERSIASEEPNVRLVRAKILLGEGDAAIVYASDVVNQRGLVSLPIPQQLNTRTPLLAAVVRGSARPALGERWMAFLKSAPAQQILKSHGFDAPGASSAYRR